MKPLTYKNTEGRWQPTEDGEKELDWISCFPYIQETRMNHKFGIEQNVLIY